MQLKIYFFLLAFLASPKDLHANNNPCAHAISSFYPSTASPSPLFHQIEWFKFGIHELADFLQIPKDKATESSNEGDEVFSLFGGAVNLDIKKARKMIRTGTIPYTKKSIPITDYAEGSYALSKAVGWPSEQGENAKIGLNLNHAQKISGDRLDEPGILIQYPGGALIIDGNHRCARKYMDGESTMEFYVLDSSAIQTLRAP